MRKRIENADMAKLCRTWDCLYVMQQISESHAPSTEAAKSPSLDDVQRIDRQSLAPGGAVSGRAGGREWRWRAADEVEGPGGGEGREGRGGKGGECKSAGKAQRSDSDANGTHGHKRTRT
jgi:hypothetical protein